MAELNLTATDNQQQTVLEHLIPMVSDELAEKINNGVYIEKDGKRLLNKKDLSTFMVYAEEQAKKTIAEQQRKGVQAVCVHGDDIMSWAIHYFEEDSIIGKLFNEDGTEYKPPAPVKKPSAKPITITPPPPKPKAQFSFFDLLNEKKAEQKTEAAAQAETAEVTETAAQQPDDEPTVEQIADSLQQAIDEKNGITPKKDYPPFYTQYIEVKEAHPESVILSRLGDFYEAFDSDAETLADELGLTITGRKIIDDVRVPMVGFPYHVSDTYFAKIRAKHSLTIIEFDGNIVTLNKASMPVCKDDLPDEDEDIEELSEAEMRQFDGDYQEPRSLDEPDEPNDTPTPRSDTSVDGRIFNYLNELLDGKLEIA